MVKPEALSLEWCPFLVNGEPGVAASMLSELSHRPATVCPSTTYPTLLFWDFNHAFPKWQGMHCGSRIAVNF
jgi:hypothetical protein